jgi:inositol transport system substrate-binding protein
VFFRDLRLKISADDHNQEVEEMKTTKAIAIVSVLMLIGIGSVWAGGRTEQTAENYRIGAAMYDLSNKFHTYIQDGIQRFIDEHDDVDVLFVDGQAESALQISQVENLISRGVDAIILVPVSNAALAQTINQCQEAGVKLVIANLMPDEEDLARIDAYVGSESIDAGLIQAEWVAEALGGEGNVGILVGDMGLEVARMRTQGNKDVFAQHPGIQVVRELEGQWDRGNAITIVENWLSSSIGDDLDAIVANNDEMAIGAFFAARQVGRDDLIIAGIDATPDALEYLGRGIDVTVFQSGLGQGYGAAELAYNLIRGQAVEKLNWIPFELVTPDLRDEYLARWE